MAYPTKEKHDCIMQIMNREGFTGTYEDAEKQLKQEDEAWIKQQQDNQHGT